LQWNTSCLTNTTIRTQAHNLTVTQLSWSHSGRFLASASRDRSFAVFERSPSPALPTPSATAAAAAAATGATQSAQAPPDAQPPTFALVQRVKLAHTRVLWGICWSHDDALLATAARDNTVKLWATPACSSSSGNEQGGAAAANDAGTHTQGSNCGAGAPSSAIPMQGGSKSVVPERPSLTLPPFPSPVTAVEFAPCELEQQGGQGRRGCKVLAVGLESGGLQLWGVQQEVVPAATQQPGLQAQQGPGERVSCTAGAAPDSGVSSGQQGHGRVLHAWLIWQSDQFCSHAGAVNAVAWQPLDASKEGSKEQQLQVASCSDDHSVRVYTVNVRMLGRGEQ